MNENGGLDRYRLIVLGDEPRAAYDRVNLTSYLDHKNAEHLSLAPAGWYTHNGIELHLGDPVTNINRVTRIVTCGSGRTFPYNKLVFATGSAPFVPPIPGTGLPGVFVYRTIEDLNAIDTKAASCKSAIVLGGGLLGLEAAKALDDAGLETHIVEKNTHLMSRQLDPAAAAVLEGRIAGMGIRIHRARRSQSIEQTPTGLRLRFTGGDSLETDMIVIAAGIRPRDELASQAGIQTQSGILVSDAMRTTDPSIFAIGECANHRGSNYGLVGPGYQMAQVVADQLMNKAAKLARPDLTTSLKLLGVNVVTFGDYLAEDCRAITRDHQDVRRQLLIRKGRLVGAVAIGEWDESGRIQQAINKRIRITGIAERRFRTTGRLYRNVTAGNVVDWPAAARVCNCLGITRGQLSQSIATGCSSIDSIRESCGAGTVCGSCEPLIATLLGTAASKPNVKGRLTLLTASLIAAAVTLAILFITPIPFADSVQSAWHRFDLIWRDSFWKQVSGFTLLGLATLGMAVSLRKRVKRIKWLNYGWWRAAHGVLGSAALIALIMHTGFRLGENLNLALSLTFLGLAIAGAATGIASALEAASSDWAIRARRWRPILTWAHIILFWPLPVLIAVHVLRVYIY